MRLGGAEDMRSERIIGAPGSRGVRVYAREFKKVDATATMRSLFSLTLSIISRTLIFFFAKKKKKNPTSDISSSLIYESRKV